MDINEEIKDAKKSIWAKWKAYIIAGIGSAIIYIGGLIIKDTKVYKDFKDVVEFGYNAKNVIIPKADSLHTYQNEEIKYLWDDIDLLFEKLTKLDSNSNKWSKRTTFYVGLIYDEEKKKLFFRTTDKEMREVKVESETGFYYYRDSHDKKRYINY